MKRIILIKYLLPAALLSVILTGCGSTDNEEKSALAEYSVQTVDVPPELILNTDFRNMVWGMSEYEIAVQEGRYADHSYPDQLFYENTVFAGFDSRLVYRINGSGEATGAEYIITIDPENNKYTDAFDSIDSFLTDMFGEPDDTSESRYGGIVRKTRTAVIEIYTDEKNGSERIRIDFEAPEGYIESKADTSRVVSYYNNKPAGVKQ
ncbi:MAG: hypothetical protein IJ446_11620 [Oscillospiraceae bacterium]|nr:hypothetical protein [Oscillospiraceae bacterium]